jgi:YVTN family beta-propeller protein
MKILIRGAVALFIVLAGCRQDPAGPDRPLPPPPVVKAVYVLNEGNFGDPAGARLSLYDADGDTTYLDVVEAANSGTHLGSAGDDIKLYNGKAYILMSGSENIAVVSLTDHVIQQSATYPGATPHEILIDSVRSRIYMTRLFANSILILDLSSLSVIDSVAVGANPQGMALIGNSLFVCNSGYGGDSTVTVVDIAADTVKATLILADGPTGIAAAPDGNLWVTCTGNAFASPPTTGKVFVLNPSTLALEGSITLTENLWGSIAIGDDGYAYVVGVTSGSFYGGPVHRISLSTRALRVNLISGTFYTLALDPASDNIYAADALAFTANGEVSVFSNQGVLLKSFTVQRGPGAIVFRY